MPLLSVLAYYSHIGLHSSEIDMEHLGLIENSECLVFAAVSLVVAAYDGFSCRGPLIHELLPMAWMFCADG